MKKRMLSLLLSLAMVLTMLPTAMAVDPSQGETDHEVLVTDKPSEEGVVEWTATPTIATLETSARPPIMPITIGSDGKVALKEGTYEDWIDRIDIPQYARDFYDILVEASDNDGEKDYLIDDEYFNTATAANSLAGLSAGDIYYTGSATAIVVAVINDVTYDEQWTAAKAAFNEATLYIYAVYNAFNRDHNEVFWLSNGYSCGANYSSNGTTATVRVYFYLKNSTIDVDLRANNFTAEDIKSGITAMESNISTILSGVSDSASCYEKLAYFNNWLTTHNEYNTGDLNNGPWDMRKATNALAGKTGENGPVCESYARALKVLCDREGIPCTLVDGYATSSGSGGEAHMWNYVQMENGKWYAVDVTWDDPVYSVGNEVKTGAESGGETDKWLLLGSESLVNTGLKFITSHPASNTVSSNGVSFTNGPLLNQTAYATLTYPQPASSLVVDNEVSLTAIRSPIRKSDLQTYTYSATGLPDGLNIDASTGAITGTLTQVTQDETKATVTLLENGIAACTYEITFPIILEQECNHEILTLYPEKAATCEEDGHGQYWECNSCKQLFSDANDRAQTTTKEAVTKSALGHNWSEAVFTWTETSGNYTANATRICENDTAHEHDQPATVNVTSVKTDPTCENAGSIVYTATATFAGGTTDETTATDTKTETIQATGHQWGEVTFEWSSDYSSAEAVRTCGNDASHKDRTTATVEQDSTSNPPTCTESGSIKATAKATVDSQQYTDTKELEGVPALGHDWGDAVFTWNTETAGNYTANATRSCKRSDCSETQTATVTMTSKVTREPTCTDTGERTWTATAAFEGGATATATETEEVSAMGHNITITHNAVTATCEQPGNSLHYECGTCHELFKDQTGSTPTTSDEVTIPATGHSWGTAEFAWTETANNYTATATRTCGNVASHKQTVTATMTSADTQATTCTAAGSRTWTATAVFEGETVPVTETKTEVVSALGHDWNDAVFTWNTETAGDYTATAKRTCKNDGSHEQTATVEVTSEVTQAATGTKTGVRTWTATVTFDDETTAIDTKEEELPILTFGISGTVKSSDGNSPVSGAAAKLVQGSKEVTTTTDTNGAFFFTNVSAGTYNLVITKDNTTKTILVTVTNDDVTFDEVKMPSENVNSKVEVQGTGTPDVAVGGVDEVAEAVAAEAGENASVTVTLTVEEKQPESEQKTEIEAAASGKEIDLYLDLSLMKMVSGGDTASSEAITDTQNNILEIVVPYDFSGKQGVTVYRYHDSAAVALTRSNTKPNTPTDGTFWCDIESGLLHIYASKFSTYAIAYDAVHDIMVSTVTNGAVSADKMQAAQGETVTITVTPDTGYTVDSIKVESSTGAITVTDNKNGTYTFTMPDDNVTITVTFTEEKDDPDTTDPSDPPSNPSDPGGSGGTSGNGGSGGGSSSTTGNVTVSNPSTANGTITSNISRARKGDMVTVTSKADSGYISASPIVTDKNGKTVAVTKNADGTYSFTMPEGGVTVTGRFVTPAQMFIDLNDSQWYRVSIAYAVENGLMDGVGNGRFNPSGITTRGMIMTILARQYGVDTTTTDSEPWYRKGMAWAMANGISDGTNPEGSITREQLATMLWRFADEPAVTGNLSAYPDADDIHDWARSAMIWAVQTGIIEGSNGKLNPRGNATRSEAAAMLTRFCQKIK